MMIFLFGGCLSFALIDPLLTAKQQNYYPEPGEAPRKRPVTPNRTSKYNVSNIGSETLVMNWGANRK